MHVKQHPILTNNVYNLSQDRSFILVSPYQRAILAGTFTNVRKCAVEAGIRIGPYTAQVFTIARDMDIDHIIPLNYVNDHGGALCLPLLKKVFANETDNLLVTEDNANQSKGINEPNEYIRPIVSYHCEYLRRCRFFVSKYELEIDRRDTD